MTKIAVGPNIDIKEVASVPMDLNIPEQTNRPGYCREHKQHINHSLQHPEESRKAVRIYKPQTIPTATHAQTTSLPYAENLDTRNQVHQEGKRSPPCRWPEDCAMMKKEWWFAGESQGKAEAPKIFYSPIQQRKRCTIYQDLFTQVSGE